MTTAKPSATTTQQPGQEVRFRLPDPPKREPDEMTSYDHLHKFGSAHYLAVHLGRPDTTVAVAVGDPLRAAFAVLSADLGGNLSVHDAVHQDPQCFPQKVHVSVHTTLA